MKDIEFSRVLESEIDAVVLIYTNLKGTQYCTWNEHYPTRELALEDVAHQRLFCLREEAKIIAVCSAVHFEDLDPLPWNPRLNNPCDIARIGVAVDRHGEGLGTLMLNHVMNWIQDQGHDGVRLLVGQRNKPARSMYARAGFEIGGETSSYGVDWYYAQRVFAVD